MSGKLLKFFKILVATILITYLLSSSIGNAWLNNNTIKITDNEGEPVLLYEESHALIIWVSNYLHWSPLEAVPEGAGLIENALKQRGFDVVVAENPTSEELIKVVNRFIGKYGYEKNNRLVIFFAGHGHTLDETDGYIVPSDVPDPIIDEAGFYNLAISMEDVIAWAKRIRSNHALFLFDSCFSGTLFETKSLANSNDAYIRTLTGKPVRQFLTAGDAGEEVPAGNDFVKLFVQGLDGDADFNDDGYVTGLEVGAYVQTRLPGLTNNAQSPQYGKIHNVQLRQGDIVFRSLTNKTLITEKAKISSISPYQETHYSLNRILYGHDNDVNSIAMTPDGKKLVSGSDDKTIIAWDISTGKPTLYLKEPGHSKGVKSVAITPDGKKIVSGSDDKTIKVWDINTGKLELSIEEPGGHSKGIKSVAITPDGKKIVSGSDDKTIKVWDINTGKLELSIEEPGGHSKGIKSVAITPDGKKIVSGSDDKTIKVWDINTGKLELSIEEPNGHSEGVKSVAITPDGKKIISGGDDETIKVWNINTGKLELSFEQPADYPTEVCTGSISDGDRSCSDDYSNRIYSMATALDGVRIIIGSESNKIKIWNTVTGKFENHPVGSSSKARSIAVSDDRRIIASGNSDDTIKIWKYEAN